MTDITIIGIGPIAGRKTNHVRIFGYRTADTSARLVETGASPREVEEIVRNHKETGEYGEVEVDERRWMFCLNPHGGEK